MSKKREQDPNRAAARVVGQTIAKHEQPLPADVEAAWATWIAGIANVDARTTALLRAAFEVGVEAGRIPAAIAFGRKGGLIGGKSRAASLSKERRQEIAKKAAQSRWGKDANGHAGET